MNWPSRSIEAESRNAARRSRPINFAASPAGGNSANRTATGVGVQANAAFSRLTYLVENIEDTFVEPILTAMHILNTLFLDPADPNVIRAIGMEIDPIEILNADVQFTMRASSKMQSKMALLQTFPLVAQTLMNPAFMQVLARQGKTVDMDEMVTMLLDMTGYKTKGTFIRKLTPEEQQAMQQAASQENDLELIKQRERMADMKEMNTDKIVGQVQNTVIEKSLEAALMPEPEEPEDER